MKKHLLAPVFLFSAIAVITFSLVGYQIYAAREVIIFEAQDTLVDQLSLAETSINADLNRIDSVISGLILDIKENSIPIANSTSSILAARQKILADIDGLQINLTDPYGIIVANSSDQKEIRNNSKVDVSDRAWFKAVKEAQEDFTYLSDPFVGRLRKDILLSALARKVTDKQGRFIGVINCSFDIRFFGNVKRFLNLKNGDSFLMAIGPSLSIIDRYPVNPKLTGIPLGRNSLTNPVIDGGLRKNSEISNSPLDHIRRIRAVNRVGRWPLILVDGRSVDALLAAWYKQSLIEIIFLMVVFFISGLLLLRIAKNQRQLELQQKRLNISNKLAALGEMAGGIAHEINNPLAIIQGKTNHIIKLIKNGKFTTDFAILELEKISKTSDRIVKIISGLKSFSREGTNDPYEGISVSSLVSNVSSVCQERFKTKDVAFEIGAIPDTVLNCKSVQIEQVLINLLNNALDAVMNLPEKWVKLEFIPNNERIEIAVIDSGKGIPPHVVEKLMQPFFTTKEVGKGTGLGLSISNAIIKSHNGSLNYVAESPNTKFVINLPLVRTISNQAAA